MTKIRLIIFSVFSGILFSLPWIFPGQSWSLFIAFLPLFWAEDRVVKRIDAAGQLTVFSLGFFAFLVWNLLATWWIGYVSVSGMLLIVSVNSLLMGLIWWIRFLLKIKFGRISGYFGLVVFWLAYEYLQHNWELRWPWLTLGNGFAASVKLIQWIEYTGVLGVSFWVLLVNVILYQTIAKLRKQIVLQSAIHIAIPLLIIFIPVCLSMRMFYQYSEQGHVFNVLLVQPNIDPYTEKFTDQNSTTQTEALLRQAASGVTSFTDLVVFPETSLPDLWQDSVLSSNSGFRPIADFIDQSRSICFLGGAITKKKIEASDSLTSGQIFHAYNSALFYGNQKVPQFSHKKILVSGVERMPFQQFFSFLPDFLVHLGGIKGALTAGEPAVFSMNEDQVRIGPVICFESVFGEHVRSLAADGANVLIVLTNDGWWRQSAGIRQHFYYSALRAVETRRSVLRCANTGISGYINQRGEVIGQTEVNRKTTLTITAKTNDRITFYVVYGDYIGRMALIASVLFFVFFLWDTWQKDKKNPH